MRRKEIPPEYTKANALRDELRRLGMEKVRARRRRRALHVAAGLVSVCAVSGVAVGARDVLVSDDAPTTAPRGDLPSRLQKAPTTPLSDARAADPQKGAPAWGMRVYTNAAGEKCPIVGRVARRRFGTGDQARVLDVIGTLTNGKFSELSDDVPGNCTDVDREHVLTAVNNYGPPAGGPRTVLFGIADRTVDLSLITPSGSVRPVRVAGDNTFLIVMSGDHALNGWSLRVTSASGSKTQSLGEPAASPPPGP